MMSGPEQKGGKESKASSEYASNHVRRHGISRVYGEQPRMAAARVVEDRI